MVSEAVVVDDQVFKLSREGAELFLYTMELQLPPRPRMSAIVSDIEAWSSRRKLPLRGVCPDPDKLRRALSDAACRQG